MAQKVKAKDNIIVFSDYKVPKAVMTLALPSVFGMLINIIYNLADTFFVGQTGDANQVAAVSVSMPVFMIFLAIGNLFGVGGCAYISRSLGEGKKEKVKTISSFCAYASMIGGAIISVIFLIFRNPILRLIGASDNTIGYANDYMFWLAISSPLIVMGICASNLVRGEGAAKDSVIGTVIGQIANVILDPIFILNKGDRLFSIEMPFGLGRGAEGAAIATVIGNVLTLVYFIVYFMRGKSILSINPRRFSAKDGIAKGVISVGTPAALNSLLMSFSNIISNMFLAKYGDNAVAAMGVAMKANMLVVMFQIGVGQGIQPLVGYCFGAKRYERMKKVIRFSMMCNIIIGAAVTLFYIVFRRQVIGIFIEDEQVIEYGVKMLTALMAPGAVIGIMFVINFSFQGMGKGIQSLILAAGRQGLIYLPMLFIMNSIVGLEGIIWAQPAADFFCVVLSLIMLKSVTNKLKKETQTPIDKD